MRDHDRLVDSSLSARWSKLDIQSECPCPRSFHSLSVFPAPAQIRRLFDENCPSLQCAVVTGGRDDSTVFNDVWVLLFATEPNANVTPHWRRASVHMAQTDSTHESAATASELLCRAYHTSTYRRTNSDGSAELWLYGGKCSTGDGPAPFIGTMLKLSVSAQPEKVYGDCNQDIRCAFTVSVECVTQQNALGNRAYHTAALHGTRRLVVYGGFTGVEFVDVVSTFDLETATWSHHCPTPAMHPAVAYDLKHNADVASAAVSGASEATPTSTPQKPADQLRVPELCRTCGALSSCVHRSRQLQRLCDGKRILSTSPSVSNRPFASRPPTTSFPPRDASTLIRVGAVDDDAAPLFCFGGEVMQTFYNSMIKLSLGQEASQWITLCDGVEIHADEDSDSPARRYSGATPPSLDRVFRAAVKDIVCSPERKLQFDDVDEVSEIIATQTCAPCAAPAPLPEPRAYHCAWAVGGRAVAVWGGFALQKRRAKFFGDLAVFDVHRCCWVPVQTNDGAAPPARASASCVQINEHGHALLFGGDDGTAYFNDSWICAFATGTEAAEFDSRVTLRAAAQRFLLSAATVSVEKPVS